MQMCTVKTSKAFRIALKTQATISFTYTGFVPWEIQAAFLVASDLSAPRSTGGVHCRLGFVLIQK